MPACTADGSGVDPVPACTTDGSGVDLVPVCTTDGSGVDPVPVCTADGSGVDPVPVCTAGDPIPCKAPTEACSASTSPSARPVLHSCGALPFGTLLAAAGMPEQEQKQAACLETPLSVAHLGALLGCSCRARHVSRGPLTHHHQHAQQEMCACSASLALLRGVHPCLPACLPACLLARPSAKSCVATRLTWVVFATNASTPLTCTHPRRGQLQRPPRHCWRPRVFVRKGGRTPQRPWAQHGQEA